MNKARSNWLLLLALLLSAAATPAYAQSPPEHFTEIEYDEVGRVKTLQTVVEESAPIISAVIPSIVRRGPPVAMEVSGSGLRGAVVTTEDAGVVISAVTATEARVRFILQADESAPLGEHLLRFTTVLGFAEVAITLRPVLPRLLAAPNPAAVAIGGTLPLEVAIDRPDVIDHPLAIVSSNLAVLTVSPNQLTVLAGSVQADALTLHGQIAGTSVLRIETAEMQDLWLPVFVTPPYQPPPGGATFYSRVLGVQVGKTSEPIATSISLVSPLLGVQLNVTPQPPAPQPVGPLIALVGVTVAQSAAPGITQVNPLLAPRLGIASGPVAFRMEPLGVVRGAGPVEIEVFGQQLSTINSADVVSGEDVTVQLLSIDGDGARAVFEVTAAADAALGSRELRLLKAGGEQVSFAEPAAALFQIVDSVNAGKDSPVSGLSTGPDAGRRTAEPPPAESRPRSVPGATTSVPQLPHAAHGARSPGSEPHQ